MPHFLVLFPGTHVEISTEWAMIRLDLDCLTTEEAI